MSPLEKDLLEAIPAPSARILLIGEELLRHRPLWEMRNPLVAIDTTSGPWSGTHAADPKPAAAILDIDELDRDAAAAAAWAAANLPPTGTLALLTRRPGNDAAMQSLATMLEQHGLTAERKTGGTPHAIWRFLQRDAVRPPLHITGHLLAADSGLLSTSVVRVRILEPFEQLGSLPGVRCSQWTGLQDPPPAGDPAAANILVVQRKIFLKPELYLQPAHARHFITVAEFDDLLLDSGFTPERYKSNLAGFHAVQASTPALADFLRQFNPEVGIFGNHLPRIRPLRKKTDQPVRVLFAAIGRQTAWREIVQSCKSVLASYGDKVATTVVGDREFFDQLQPLNSQFRPVLAYPDYLAELEQSHIAILPLADTQFDRCKTDLKFIECAESGTAVLASRVVYGQTVRPGDTGFLYHQPDEFRRHLRKLIEDTPMREKMATKAHRYVSQKRALANHVRRQYEWYLSLVERREELDRQLKRRLGQS